MSAFMVVAGMIAFGLFGLLQLVVGFHGLEVEFGTIWAYIGAGLALLRFTPLIVVGAYFGAVDIWGLHPALAVLFAMPGLLLMVPGIIGTAIAAVRR
jgi:hypothetical protein